MEKIKFKNGKVSVITDIDEIIKATLNSFYCHGLNAESSQIIESYLRKNKPIKCILLRREDDDEYSVIYQYCRKNNENFYDTYNGRKGSSLIFDIHRELFLEYYNTVNDDYRVNNILKNINVGDEFFYKENFSKKYEKAKITDIKVCINFERPVVKLKTTKKICSSIYLLNVNEDGCIKDCSGTYYPPSFRRDIENKIMENKKKRLKSLERSINKLKHEIENGIVW